MLEFGLKVQISIISFQHFLFYLKRFFTEGVTLADY